MPEIEMRSVKHCGVGTLRPLHESTKGSISHSRGTVEDVDVPLTGIVRYTIII